MSNGRILVIGDSCRDVHVYCSAERLCPDKPVPVIEVIDQTENPGMAKNVFENIKAVHGTCDILTNPNWYDVTKTRYMHKSSNHMFLRIDSRNHIERIDIKDVNYDYDIIIVSDYNKGFLTEHDIKEICSNHPCVFLDTKKVLGEWANRAKFIKINEHEYERAKSYIESNLVNKLIKTCGGDGCLFNGQMFPVKKVEVIDLSGAGDSFLAGLVVKYSSTKDIIKSIKYANKCALKVVQQKGVVTI